MNEKNQTQPPLETTESAAPPAEQRRPRGRRRYGRRRYYNRGERNDNFNEPYSEPRNDAPGSGTGDPVATETMEGAPEGDQGDREPEFGEGIIEISGKGFGFLRDPKRNFVQTPQDIFVTPEIVRRFALRDGMWIYGETRDRKSVV